MLLAHLSPLPVGPRSPSLLCSLPSQDTASAGAWGISAELRIGSSLQIWWLGGLPEKRRVSRPLTLLRV